MTEGAAASPEAPPQPGDLGGAAASPEAPPHYVGFDGLRALCISVIVGWHALLPFTSRARGVKADITSETVDLVAWLIRGLALKELFLIAGFFAHQGLLRYGPRVYLRHRLPRLVVPCLLAMVLYNGLLHWRWSVWLNISIPAVLAFHIKSGNWYEVLSPMHLWFIFDLIIMTWIGVALRQQIQPLQPILRRFLASRWLIFGLAIPTALCSLLHQPRWPSILPGTLISASPSYPLITAFATHFTFFLFGWALYSSRDLLGVLAGPWKSLMAAAVALRGFYCWLVFESSRSDGLLPFAHWLDALGSWALVLGLLGGFWACMTTDRPLWRYLADSGYWCYLTHLFFMTEIQLALNGRGWSIVAQYGLVVTGTWALLGLTYEFLVRYSWIGSMLHGRRIPPAGGRLKALAWTPSDGASAQLPGHSNEAGPVIP